MAFFHCREEGKIPALLHLLKDVIPTGQQAVVFCATRHHVEYLHLVLDEAGVSNTFIYSHLGKKPCGKSKMTAMILNSLQRSPGVARMRFYFTSIRVC